jgi:hypothetical protein
MAPAPIKLPTPVAAPSAPVAAPAEAVSEVVATPLKPEPVAPQVSSKPLPQATIKLQPAGPAAASLRKFSSTKPKSVESELNSENATGSEDGEVSVKVISEDLPLPLVAAAAVLALAALAIQLWTYLS